MFNSNENENHFKHTKSKPFYLRLKHQTMSNDESLPKVHQRVCSVHGVIDVFTVKFLVDFIYYFITKKV